MVPGFRLESRRVFHSVASVRPMEPLLLTETRKGIETVQLASPKVERMEFLYRQETGKGHYFGSVRKTALWKDQV